MTALLLALQLFTYPIINAYAVQVKSNIVISVTYDLRVPVVVCVSSHALDDADLTDPLDTHCFKPTSTIGDFDTWTNERIDMVNFKVTLRFADGKQEDIALVMKSNT